MTLALELPPCRAYQPWARYRVIQRWAHATRRTWPSYSGARPRFWMRSAHADLGARFDGGQGPPVAGAQAKQRAYFLTFAAKLLSTASAAGIFSDPCVFTSATLRKASHDASEVT